MGPEVESLAPAGSLVAARGGFAATLMPDGRLLITGGSDDADQAIGTGGGIDPDGRSFAILGTLREARASHTDTLLPDGQVLLVGGWSRVAPRPFPARLPSTDSTLWCPV